MINKNNKKFATVSGVMLLSSIASSMVSQASAGAAIKTTKTLISGGSKVIGAGVNNVVLPIVRGVLSALAVPIAILIIVYIVHYNYFVLHRGPIQRIANATFGALGSGIGLAAKGINMLLRKNTDNAEKKDNNEKNADEKKGPELIAVDNLKQGIEDIEKKFTNKANIDINEIKNEIKKLKDRIYATRGVFSDRNWKNFASYTNALKYYVTTGLIFRSTRFEYNDCEKTLNELENSIDTISKIASFNKKLKDYLIAKDNENSLSLDDLIGNSKNNEKNIHPELTDTLSYIQNLEKGELENFAQSQKKELYENYVALIEKATKEEVNSAKFDTEKLESIKGKIPKSKKKVPSLPKEHCDKIDSLTLSLDNLIALVKLNNETDKILAKIKKNNEEIDTDKKVDEINKFLYEANGKLDVIIGGIKNLAGFGGPEDLTDEQIELLDRIYENYEELEKAYKNIDPKKADGVNNEDANNKFIKNKNTLDAICGENSNIRKAKDTYLNLSNDIKNIDASVVKKDEDTINKYLYNIRTKLRETIELLEGKLQNLDQKNSPKLMKVLNKKINNELTKYKSSLDNMTDLYKKIEQWHNDIKANTAKNSEKVTKDASDEELIKLAQEACDSKSIDEYLETIDIKYKENLKTLFNAEKAKKINKAKENLEKVKTEIKNKESEINEIKNKLKNSIEAAENFLKNPSSANYKDEYINNLHSILTEVDSYTKNHNIGRQLFYPEGFDEKKVLKLITLLNKYGIINKQLSEKTNTNDLLDILNYVLEANKVNEENIYNDKYYEYCTNLIEEKISGQLKKDEGINYVELLAKLQKVKDVLPNKYKESLENIIKSVETKRDSALNTEINIENDKIIVTEKVGRIIDAESKELLNRAIEGINHAREILKGEKLAKNLISAFSIINESDTTLKAFEVSTGIKPNLPHEKMDNELSVIQESLKNLNQESIFEEFFKNFVSSLNNNKNTDKLFNNIRSFFDKFYKGSDIDNFLKENENLKTDLKNILSDGQEVEAFSTKYKKIPNSIENIMVKYFKNETIGTLKKYIKSEISLNDNNLVLLNNISNNMFAFNQLSKSNDFESVYTAIEKVLEITKDFDKIEANGLSAICNFLINSATDCHKNENTLIEDVFVKLLCDFVKGNKSFFKEDKFKDFIETFKNDNKGKNLEDFLSKENIEKLFKNIPNLNPNYKSNPEKAKDAINGAIGFVSEKFQNFNFGGLFSK